MTFYDAKQYCCSMYLSEVIYRAMLAIQCSPQQLCGLGTILLVSPQRQAKNIIQNRSEIFWYAQYYTPNDRDFDSTIIPLV